MSQYTLTGICEECDKQFAKTVEATTGTHSFECSCGKEHTIDLDKVAKIDSGMDPSSRTTRAGMLAGAMAAMGGMGDIYSGTMFGGGGYRAPKNPDLV